MNNNDKATLNIFPLITERWSPRAFSTQEVEESKILSLIEAARLAPSAFNEQPWRFVIGKKGDEKYQKIFQSLGSWNQEWNENVPVLVLNLANKNFSHNNNVNATARYDLGQAVFAMVLESVHLGLVSHQMSGFDHEKALELLSIPDGFEAVSVTAFGYQGDDSQLPEEFYKIEHRIRERKPIDDLLF